MLYLRARYANPASGTFLTRDPFEGVMQRVMSRNGYSYAEGNPINYTDPSGKFIGVIAIGVGVVVTVAALVAAYDIIQRAIRGVYCVAGRPECYEQTMLERLCNIPPYGMGRQLRPQPFPITHLPDGPVSIPANPQLGNPVEQFPADPPVLPTVPPVQITPWPVIIEAVSTKWSGKSTSGRKDVEELANQIEDMYPGQVLGIDRPIVNPAKNDDITDIDVETTNFLIQVKSNNMSGWYDQAETTLVNPHANPQQKNVIVFNSGRPLTNQYRRQAAVIKHPSNPNIGVTVYGNDERQTMLRRLP